MDHNDYLIDRHVRREAERASDVRRPDDDERTSLTPRVWRERGECRTARLECAATGPLVAAHNAPRVAHLASQLTRTPAELLVPTRAHTISAQAPPLDDDDELPLKAGQTPPSADRSVPLDADERRATNWLADVL
eukprot:4210382-Prymnesium_polylepis.1